MWKKILEFFIKRVVWPLVQTILELVLVQAAQWIIEKIRGMLRNWRQEEEATATSPEQREDIHRKYTRREADLASMEKEIPEKMREIVRDAMHEADKQTQQLISESDKLPATIPKKRSRKPRWRRRKT
jgi:biopolymer transport protein ExbB/TolQ